MNKLEKIQLKQINAPEYFEDYFKLKSDPSSILWSGFEFAPDYFRLKSHFENLIKSNKKLFFLTIDDQTIGYCQISDNSEEYEIEGYSILSKYAGHGYGYKMINLVVDHLWSEKRKGIMAWVSKNNISSLKCLAKVGFCQADNIEKSVELKALHRVDKFIAMYLLQNE